MANRRRATVPCLILSLALTACDKPSMLGSCPRGAGEPSLLFSLYFGRNIPGRGPLTETEWSTFVDTVVTPALPDGYTIINADGAWLNPDQHQTMRDPTKVLQVALPDTATSIAAVNRIRSSYQSQFHQQLVGLAMQAACTSF